MKNEDKSRFSVDLIKLKILAYLTRYVKDFKYSKAGGSYIFTCPACFKEVPSAVFMTNPFRIFCNNTNCKYDGHIIDIAFRLEENLRGMSEEEIAFHLTSKHNIMLPAVDRKLVSFYFDYYESKGFDLVPCTRDTKECFEEDWPNRIHKNKEEWYKWFENKWNMGVKCGKSSNITVIDIDTKDIPDLFKSVDTLIQTTTKGFHYIFQYEKDLPSTRINDLKIDILNDGRQFITFPSLVEGKERTWNFHETKEIPKMPKEIYDFIKTKVKRVVKESSFEETITEDIKRDNLGLGTNVLVNEGNRNNTLIRLGGVLRKKLNINDTYYVMDIFNKNFVKPSLPNRDLYTLAKTIDKYVLCDEKELADKILKYLSYAEEGTSKDIEQAMGDKKERIDKALAFLIKEKFVVKRGRMYILIKKIQWLTSFPSLCNEVPFKVPYFDDIAIFNWGDMIILGGMPGFGKTTISMNILKRLVDQGICPYYICLETGSRFIKTSCALGLKEGQYKWSIQTDPTKIEIEENSVCLIDWLLIKDKAVTDTVMQYFVEQLVKTNSFLIIFMQLKENGTWFSPNMITQFPAFAARYLYDDVKNGQSGAWNIDKIREAKRQARGGSIPCRYFWDEKLLKRLDEIDAPKTIVNGGEKVDVVI